MFFLSPRGSGRSVTVGHFHCWCSIVAPDWLQRNMPISWHFPPFLSNLRTTDTLYWKISTCLIAHGANTTPPPSPKCSKYFGFFEGLKPDLNLDGSHSRMVKETCYTVTVAHVVYYKQTHKCHSSQDVHSKDSQLPKMFPLCGLKDGSCLVLLVLVVILTDRSIDIT